MTWANRVGEFVRNFVVLAIDLFTIGSEFVRQLATAIDDFADGLKEALEQEKSEVVEEKKEVLEKKP